MGGKRHGVNLEKYREAKRAQRWPGEEESMKRQIVTGDLSAINNNNINNKKKLLLLLDASVSRYRRPLKIRDFV